jgi:hypothetical protein
MSKAADEIGFLRAQREATPPKTMLYGSVTKYDAGDPRDGTSGVKPMAGLKVEATGPGGKMETLTGGSGEFAFRNVATGNYEVKPLLPDSLTVGPAKIRITEQETCSAARFAARWNGRISGRVLLAGKPLPELFVGLANLASGPDQAISGTTNADGYFEFTEVQPGEYRLDILDGLFEQPSQQYPFPPLFYPAATTPELASVIAMGPGQKMAGMDFHIPDFARRPLRVEVHWPDGTRVAGAHIHIEYEQQWCWKRGCTAQGHYTADENGRVMFAGYGDGRVRIFAIAKDAAGREQISDFKELELNDLPFATILVMAGLNTYSK